MKSTWYLWEAAGLLAADQIVKTYSEENLKKGEEKILTDKIVLRHAENKGMCLNVLEDRPSVVRILSAAAAAAVSAVQLMTVFRGKGFWRKQGTTLLAAGALSNTADRFLRGHVTDYIGFRLNNEKAARITYNLADFFIAAGAVLLMAVSFLQDKKKQ